EAYDARLRVRELMDNRRSAGTLFLILQYTVIGALIALACLFGRVVGVRLTDDGLLLGRLEATIVAIAVLGPITIWARGRGGFRKLRQFVEAGRVDLLLAMAWGMSGVCLFYGRVEGWFARTLSLLRGQEIAFIVLTLPAF